jgi:hypothetical protein
MSHAGIGGSYHIDELIAEVYQIVEFCKMDKSSKMIDWCPAAQFYQKIERKKHGRDKFCQRLSPTKYLTT